MWEGEEPERKHLPAARYYLGGVNYAQRKVYDDHCASRYAARSPFHYTSEAEVDRPRISHLRTPTPPSVRAVCAHEGADLRS